MILQASFKAFELLNSQNFTLPQRRHRVWGIATLISAGVDPKSVQDSYKRCLRSMRANFQFPREMNFGNKPHEAPRNERRQKHVTATLETNFGDMDVFIDCAGSMDRPAKAYGVMPCITPRHPMYSVGLQRYMDSEDFLNGQGLWKSNFSDVGWNELMANLTLAHDLAGNSFSSTVCQAVFLSSVVASSAAWEKITVQESSQEATQAGNEEPQQILRRVRQKRQAPEFDQVAQREESNRKKKEKKPKPGNIVRSVRSKYKRRKPGVDSRAKNSGKKSMTTIYQKEQVNLAFNCK